MNERLDGLIRDLTLDGARLQGLSYDAAAKTWWVPIAVVDASGSALLFELEFQHLESTGPAVPEYLVVSWVVIPPDEIRDQPLSQLELLQAVNELNGEPGVKFRLHADARKAVSLVCETDLPVALLTPDLLRQAVERGRDLVAAYFDDIASVARP